MNKPRKLNRQTKSGRNMQAVISIIVGVVCLALIGSVALLLNYYYGQNEKEAGNYAKASTQRVADVYQQQIHSYENRTSQVAGSLSEKGFSTRNEFLGYISALSRTDEDSGIKIMRFFKDGVEYADDGTEIQTYRENIQITQRVRNGLTGYAGHFYDKITTHGVLVFVEKLENFQFADYIVLFYSPSVLNITLPENVRTEVEFSEFTVAVNNDGEILDIPFKKDTYNLSLHNNIYEILSSLTNNVGFIDGLKSYSQLADVDVFPVMRGNHPHIAAVGKMSNLTVISFYDVNGINKSASRQIATIMGVIIVAFGLLFVSLLYFILESHQSKKALATVNDWNAILECNTRSKFIHNADEIMRDNTDTKFVVISIEVKNFNYLVSHSSNNEVEGVLQFLKLLYKSAIRLDETFGYENEGTFLLLWRFKEERDLANRLTNIKNIAQKYDKGMPLGFKLNLSGGIAIREVGEQVNAKKLTNRATIARTSLNQRFSFSTFRLYNESIEFERITKENIETQMEAGLDNEEFEIFLQPKLDITTNRLAGAEALVRWFNKSVNETMMPDTFIPLFEANGFIEKLDFFVFEKICKIIRTSLDEEKMILPISVNVSRVTSSKDDFLEKYISTKKRYRIPNGFLTIEFTESYAYEEYERLQNVVDTLRSNGFKCSIDDFGTKYSTYNTLKVLTMDELKLDKFFIEPGPSGEKSTAIIESVINLAHRFNLTIVQEGVETKEQMALLKSLGCDVIQGFYVSKPIPRAEYSTFILDHKIKYGY